MVLAIGFALQHDAVVLRSGIFGANWAPIWVLLAWVEFVHLARWAGGFPIRGPLGPLAFLGGAFLGEIGAVLLLAPRAPTAGLKARVALTASAGALMSPIGSPVTLLLVEPGTFGWLPLALAALSWPSGWAQDDPNAPALPLTSTGLNRNAGVLLAVIVGLIWGPSDLWVLAFGCLGLMLLNLRSRGKPKTPWGAEVWICALAVLCLLSVSSGAFWEVKEGIALAMNHFPDWAASALVGAAALLSIAGTEEGAVLVAHSIQDTGFSTLDPHVWRLVGAGIAVGGITPLLMAKAFRAGFWIWILQLGLVLLWANAIH